MRLRLKTLLLYFFVEEADKVKVRQASDTHFASRQPLLKGRVRVGVTGMSLERREIAHLCRVPSDICRCHIYSDGSPVTGTEIQRMILQIIMTTGEVHTFYMPGSALMYGHCRAIDKAVTFCCAYGSVLDPSASSWSFGMSICAGGKSVINKYLNLNINQ